MAISEEDLRTLLKEGNYSTRFDDIRRGMCLTSLFKYGTGRKNFPDKVDALASMEKCIEKYKETHNTEYLADAANYLMFEFMYPKDKLARYTPTDSDGSAGIHGMSVKEIEDFKNNNY